MKSAVKILLLFKNKYFISLVLFAGLMIFVDHNDIFVQLSRKKQLKELIESKKYYQKEIAKTKTQLTNLETNSAAIEAYAREKFYMKRDNEDVFIVQQPENSPEKK